MRKFFRIELDKTGAILSCTETEASEKGGKFVRYVEALDAAGACEQVKAWWLARREAANAATRAHQAGLRKAGLCLQCARASVEPGRVSYCKSCRLARAARRAERAAGAPPVFTRVTTAIEAKERLSAYREKQIKTKGKSYEATYRRCLAHFDKLSPKQYRSWLVGKISALEAKRLAKQKKAA